jgi:hypothetical protein
MISMLCLLLPPVPGLSRNLSERNARQGFRYELSSGTSRKDTNGYTTALQCVRLGSRPVPTCPTLPFHRF